MRAPQLALDRLLARGLAAYDAKQRLIAACLLLPIEVSIHLALEAVIGADEETKVVDESSGLAVWSRAGQGFQRIQKII